MTLPPERGRFGVPNFQLYYLIAQCSYAHLWFHPDPRIPFLCPEADLTLPDSLLTVLPKGMPRDPQDIQMVSTTCWACDKLRRLMGSDLL